MTYSTTFPSVLSQCFYLLFTFCACYEITCSAGYPNFFLIWSYRKSYRNKVEFFDWRTKYLFGLIHNQSFLWTVLQLTDKSDKMSVSTETGLISFQSYMWSVVYVDRCNDRRTNIFMQPGCGLCVIRDHKSLNEPFCHIRTKLSLGLFRFIFSIW